MAISEYSLPIDSFFPPAGIEELIGGLLTAIQQHLGSGSEANAVITAFNRLAESQKQDMLNFLRSL